MSDNEITIRGHSDDLILVEGEITRELYAKDGEPTRFSVGGGYVLEAEYLSDATWEISVVESPDNANYKHFNAGPKIANGYTEMVKINDPQVDYEATINE